MVPFERSQQFSKVLTKFLLYLEERYEPFNSLRLNPKENIMHNMHKSSIKTELSSTAMNSQINRPGVTLHIFRFLGDFEKGFAEPNALLCYLLSWPCCWIKTKYSIALPFLKDVKIKCSDNSGTPYRYCIPISYFWLTYLLDLYDLVIWDDLDLY